MEKVLTKKVINENRVFFAEEINRGKTFIYPTDTLHGLGVNALSKEGVRRIIKIKKRPDKAFLIIAPTIDWIFLNCEIANNEIRNTIINKLPGPYSFILRLKNPQAVNPLAVNFGTTIGVRLPDNWFAEIIRLSGVPFVSTSINISGEASARSLSEVSKEIIGMTDYVVWDEYSSNGKGSMIIDVSEGRQKILRY